VVRSSVERAEAAAEAAKPDALMRIEALNSQPLRPVAGFTASSATPTPEKFSSRGTERTARSELNADTVEFCTFLRALLF